MPARAIHKKLQETILAKGEAESYMDIEELASLLAMPVPTVKEHLQILSNMGFVKVWAKQVRLTSTGRLANVIE